MRMLSSSATVEVPKSLLSRLFSAYRHSEGMSAWAERRTWEEWLADWAKVPGELFDPPLWETCSAAEASEVDWKRREEWRQGWVMNQREKDSLLDWSVHEKSSLNSPFRLGMLLAHLCPRLSPCTRQALKLTEKEGLVWVASWSLCEWIERMCRPWC